MNTPSASETHTADMLRLLRVARESGVQLRRSTEGDMWATSVSEPGRLYPLTPSSCGCRGFKSHGRCRHLAALHAHLGWLPGTHPTETESRVSSVHGLDLVHTPSGWFEDDINGTGRLRWKPARTSIYRDGIELVRISGESPATVVMNPGPGGTECTDVFTDRSHYDEVVYRVRSIEPTANLAQLLEKADLWRADEFLDEALDSAVA